MDYQKPRTISSMTLTYVTLLGVIFAMIYYLWQAIEINILEVVLSGIIYIALILSLLYTLKRISPNPSDLNLHINVQVC